MEIRLAVDDQDISDVGRLRYEIYIDEQRKKYPEADHVRKLFLDRYDDNAWVVLAKYKDRLAGTVRANQFSDPEFKNDHIEKFGLAEIIDLIDEKSTACSRLAVFKGSRGLVITQLLFETIFAHGWENGIRYCFIHCSPEHLKLMKKFGFREYKPVFEDTLVGLQHRLVLILDDIDHLVSCSSPFTGLLDGVSVGESSREFLFDHFSLLRK